MRVSETIDQARRLIEIRLAEIQVEVDELKRALAGLRGGGAHPPRTDGGRRSTTAPTPSTRSGKAASRSRQASRSKAPERAARGERREQLLATIKASPGARPSELADEIGIRPTQVSVLIAKLRGERLIVKDGKGYALRA